jgi:chorismate dehydratase
MSSNHKLQLCEINYTNVWPITHYFPSEHYRKELDIIRSVPSELNKGMLQGTFDLGPISSFAYGASYKHYVLLPDLSVSALGPVRSILLFYRDNLETLKNGRISLTKTSATSVNLLKIIIEKFYGGKPTYHFAEPVLHDMMEHNEAALLIGDDAIRASWEERGYRVLDLGKEWTRLTGHSMTFAVWAVRREAADRHHDLIARIHQDYLNSKRKAKLDPDGVISAAVERLGGSYAYWDEYFGGLSHDLGPVQCAGLQLYYEYAAELSLLPEPVQLHFFK